MKRTLVILFATCLALAACAPGAPGSSDGDTPVNSETPPAPGSPSYEPQPGDEKLSRQAAYVGSVDLLTMESFPLQFSLALKGELPTPCNQLRVRVGEPDAQGGIAVDIYSVVDPSVSCTQVLQPFEVNVPLGSFPTGHYKLIINDGQGPEFDA